MILPRPLFDIVLYQPEIPNNTGNIGRTCVGTGSRLHLIGPLGFEINDRQLKRAGLDYWPHLDFVLHDSWEAWWTGVANPQRVFFLSKKATRCLYDFSFQRGDTFVFGRETTGLPEDLLARFPEQALKLPILGPIRSYNLANAVAMTLGEAMRQVNEGEALW